MRPGWIGAIVFIWAIALILSSVPVGENLFEDEEATESIDSQLSFTEVWAEEDWGTLVNPLHWGTYFSDLRDMAFLRLPLFGEDNSPFQIIRWMILAPIIATVIFSLIIVFIGILQRNL
jgi:hypothetical protein